MIYSFWGFIVFGFAVFFNFNSTCLKLLLSNICIQKLKINPKGTHIVSNFLRSLRQWLELGVENGKSF